MKLTLKFDSSAFLDGLSLLAETAHRCPELRDSLVDLIETGAELFTVESHALPAAVADELIVRLNPTERFEALVAAARAWNSDLGLLEHAQPPQVAS